MQMSRQPAQPALNLPRAIVEFVDLIRDPSWLPAFVAAAEAVADAGKLTIEEAQRLADAQAVVEEAAHKEAALAEAAAFNENRTAQLKVGEGIVAKREKECDDRNTALGKREQELAALEQDFEAKLKLLEEKSNSQAGLDAMLVEEEERLKAWAGELAQEQRNWDAARKLVTKKAG